MHFMKTLKGVYENGEIKLVENSPIIGNKSINNIS